MTQMRNQTSNPVILQAMMKLSAPIAIFSMMGVAIFALILAVVMMQKNANLLEKYEWATENRQIILVSPEGLYTKLSNVEQTSEFPRSVLRDFSVSFAKYWLSWRPSGAEQNLNMAFNKLTPELQVNYQARFREKKRQIVAQNITSEFFIEDIKFFRFENSNRIRIELSGKYKAWTGSSAYIDREETVSLVIERSTPTQEFDIGLRIVEIDEPMFRSPS